MQSQGSVVATRGWIGDRSRIAAPVVLILVAEALAVTYFLAAMRLAGTLPFGMDEILAVWVGRLSSPAEINAALWNGAEFSPPTYDLLLHVLFEVFGSGLLVARLPSIIAVLVAAAAVARIVWTRLGPLPGVVSFGLVLNSRLFDFAVQVRPYALVVALAALALLVWNDCKPHARNVMRAIVLAALLFACVSLHVYAVVLFAVFGLLEALVSVADRRIRISIWLALVGAFCASAVWWPLMSHLAAFNGGDTSAPRFYASPTLGHLANHILGLVVDGQPGALVLLAIALLAGAATVTAYAFGTGPHARPPARRDEAQVAFIAMATLAALPVGFALALFVTHVFSARYALVATFGTALFLVLAIGRMPYRTWIYALLLPILCVLPFARNVFQVPFGPALALINRVGAAGPIVVGDGEVFLELMEGATPDIRARLVFLTAPPGRHPLDPTNENQVKRLLAFRPDLHVEDAESFLAANTGFADLCLPNQVADLICPWLVEQGRIEGVLGLGADVMMLKVKPRGSDARAS